VGACSSKKKFLYQTDAATYFSSNSGWVVLGRTKPFALAGSDLRVNIGLSDSNLVLPPDPEHVVLPTGYEKISIMAGEKEAVEIYFNPQEWEAKIDAESQRCVLSRKP
jgi:hypothetical protein